MTLYTIINSLKKNPDYCGAVVSGYMYMGLNILVQIILVPLYISNLGKYQFGILMIMLSFMNVAAMGVGWMSGGISRVLGEYAAIEDYEGFNRAYVLAKIIYVGYALIIALGMIIFGFFFQEVIFELPVDEDNRDIQLAIVTAAAYFVVQYEFAVERLAYIAVKRQIAGNIFQILSLIIFVISVWPWLTHGGGLFAVLACLLGSVIAARLIAWLYNHYTSLGFKLKNCLFDSEIRPLLKRLTGRMGAGYLLYGMIFMTMQADVIIVGWLGGAEIAAEFVLVWKIAEVIIQLIWKMPEYLAPYLIHMDARKEKEQLRRIYQKGLNWLILISLVGGFGYAIFGQWVVSIWVGTEIAPNNTAAYYLAGLAIFWLGMARLPSIFAYAMVNLRRLVTVSGIELLGKLVLTVGLFPRLGYLSPLVAISLMHICGIALAYRKICIVNKASQ